MGSVFKRKIAKVIRYRCYNKEIDPENFYREQIMLFFPWMNEEQDIINHDCNSKYTNYLTLIKENREKYNLFAKYVEELDSELMEEEEEINENSEFDPEYRPYGMVEINQDLSNEFPDLIQNDISMHKSKVVYLADHEYMHLMRSLNLKQRQFLPHLMSNVINDNIFHEMIGGGAGVGKSTLISAIHQTIARYFRRQSGFDPQNAATVLVAPTGKAAFNIDGNTIHSIFQIPINKKGPLTPLTVNLCSLG